jgi:hypothetical protein
MKSKRPVLVTALLIFFAASAVAQFVKGNEAVKLMPDGSRKVETPPLPNATLGKPCPAAQTPCATSGWRMVETSMGLSECTEPFAREGTCRPSTYGSEKRSRIWIVKANGQWLQCQFPALSDKCVSLKSLPVGAVQ